MKLAQRFAQDLVGNNMARSSSGEPCRSTIASASRLMDLWMKNLLEISAEFNGIIEWLLYRGYPHCIFSTTQFSPSSYPTFERHVGSETLTAYRWISFGELKACEM